MSASTKKAKEPVWISLKEGDRRIYVLTHPDPAIHERFVIERIVASERKAPYFEIQDKFGKLRGWRDRLFEAKKVVNTRIRREAENPDIGVGIANDVARGDIVKAFMRIIDYINEQDKEVKKDLEYDLEEMRRALRSL